MNKVKLILTSSLVSAALAIAGYRLFDKTDSAYSYPVQFKESSYVNSQAPLLSSAGNPDFVRAASMVAPAVVHIKTTYSQAATQSANPFFDFFGLPQAYAPVHGSGSGVIITPDGYIATNNHVIEKASHIEVVLPDKRSYKAALIGSDHSTDLALLKVNGDNLPVVTLGNSDEVEVGEWVLAVGYPFTLNSTVTAGIISAKGRSIGILGSRSQDSYYGGGLAAANTAIESFIQTDAAINPGNSGGALVNTAGQLIGINAAIASQTGSYAGYGFAIPVNLMRKIVSDFRKYGEVKRAYLGVTFPAPAVEEQIFRERKIDPAFVKGVYIMGVEPGSGAAAAGLKEGDIIQNIDGVPVVSSAELSERIARHYPGDTLRLSYLRHGRTRLVDVTLKGEETGKDVATHTSGALQARLGATFAPVPDIVKQRYRLSAGVYVSALQKGGFFEQTGIPVGTIITRVNGKPVNNLAELTKAAGTSRTGTMRLEGITPDGTAFVLTIPFSA